MLHLQAFDEWKMLHRSCAHHGEPNFDEGKASTVTMFLGRTQGQTGNGEFINKVKSPNISIIQCI